MKKYIGLVLSLTSVGILFYIIYNQKEQIKQLKENSTEIQIIPGGDIRTVNITDSLQYIVDSLHDENFNNSTIIGRYELSLEHLKESNPKAAVDFEQFYNHETE